MNELNSQPNSPSPAEQALTEIIRLRKEAYAEGYRAGYQRGFEYGAAVAMSQPAKEVGPS